MFPRIIKLITLLVFASAANLQAQVAALKFRVFVPETNNKDVYMAGSFNGWKAGDSLYRMRRADDGSYRLTVPLFRNKNYQYKYTLGNWETVEVATNDSQVHNRKVYSSKRKKVVDTVAKWNPPKQAAATVMSPQLKRVNEMKDSVVKNLQAELAPMLDLLRGYVENLLQPNPSSERHQQMDKQAMERLGAAYRQLSDLFWKVFGNLTAEQKNKILTAINQPGGKNDLINTLMGAFNQAMQDKPSVP